MDKKDLLQRDKFIENTQKYIQLFLEDNKNASIAIDGRWGCGKTFVVKSLINEFDIMKCQDDDTIEKKRYFVSYYNSWEYDYYDEPLVAIINNLLEAVEKFNAKVKDEDSLKTTKIKKFFNTFGETLSDVLQHFSGINLKEIKDNTLGLTKKYDKNADLQDVIFKLQEKIKVITRYIPLVIVVDELDRCVPSYAIKVLERLHHVFDGLENVVLLVAIDKLQLERSIETLYGVKVDTERYLKKFFDITLCLDEGKLIENWVVEYEAQLFNQFKSRNMFYEYGKYYPEMVRFVQELLDTIEIRSREKIIEKAILVSKILKMEKTIMFNENIIAFLIMFLIAKDRYTSEGSIQWMYDFIMNSRLHRSVNVADVLDVFRKYSKEDAKIMVAKDKFLALIENYRRLSFAQNSMDRPVLTNLKRQVSGVCLGLFVKILNPNEVVDENVTFNYSAAKKILEVCEFLR